MELRSTAGYVVFTAPTKTFTELVNAYYDSNYDPNIALRFDHETLLGINFNRKNMSRSSFQYSRLADCNFKNTILTNTNMFQATFQTCRFGKADLCYSNAAGAKFELCDMAEVTIGHAIQGTYINCHSILSIKTESKHKITFVKVDNGYTQTYRDQRDKDPNLGYGWYKARPIYLNEWTPKLSEILYKANALGWKIK